MNRHARSGALMLCLATLTCGCVTNPPSAEDRSVGSNLQESNAALHERLADRALGRGDFEAARDSSRESLRLDPSRAGAAMLLARVELLCGRPREALFAAMRVARLAELDPAAWLLVFDCAEAAGDRNAADLALERAIALGSHEALLAHAGLALESGDRAPIAKLLDDRPGDRIAASLYAEHLARDGELEESLAILDRALLDAPDPTLESSRARLRVELGLPEDSEIRNAEDRLLAASRALKFGDAKTALTLFRDAAKDDPMALGPRIGIGEALFALDDAIGAEAAFESALAIDPRDVDALLGLARVRLRVRSFDAAIDPLERALSVRRDLACARGLLVAAAIGLGDLPRARLEAADLRRLDPGGALDLKCRALITEAEASAR